MVVEGSDVYFVKKMTDSTLETLLTSKALGEADVWRLFTPIVLALEHTHA